MAENEKIEKKGSNGDFHLNPAFYEELEEAKIYVTEKRVAKIFGVKNKETGEPFLRITSKSKKPFGWRFNYGVDLFNFLDVGRLFHGVRKIAKKLGWKVGAVEDIEKLKKQLREKEETILNLEQTYEEIRIEHEKTMVRFRLQQKKILKSKSKSFQDELRDYKNLIKKSESESILEIELQNFLYDHPWLFGTEYVNAEPQKMRGAHSKFDFYLERFNKTNDIIEIKLLSDQIINKDGGISAKVIQAVDQLIDYMESSMAAAHSTVISQEEGINELRPRGMVIIGKDNSTDAKIKLHKWNYQFAHITILTYEDIAEKATSLLENIKENK